MTPLDIAAATLAEPKEPLDPGPKPLNLPTLQGTNNAAVNKILSPFPKVPGNSTNTIKDVIVHTYKKQTPGASNDKPPKSATNNKPSVQPSTAVLSTTIPQSQPATDQPPTDTTIPPPVPGGPSTATPLDRIPAKIPPNAAVNVKI
jgi:hypothetical protein